MSLFSAVNSICCIPFTYTGDKKNCSWVEIGRQMGASVLICGGKNHRVGLFDMVMIKDNHISAAGGIVKVIRSVDEYLNQKNLEMDVEVEAGHLRKCWRIMLDNMVVPLENGGVDVMMLGDAVELISGRVETEASGNVTIETVHKIGQSGVTFISSGARTHSVTALDISLKIDTELPLRSEEGQNELRSLRETEHLHFPKKEENQL